MGSFPVHLWDRDYRWDESETLQLDRRMQGLHPRSDRDGVYVERNQGVRLMSVEETVNYESQSEELHGRKCSRTADNSRKHNKDQQ